MSAVARNQVFSAVHTIGGLLPADMLVRVAEGKDVSGSLPKDYQVVGARSVRDEAERHWDYLRAVWSELREHFPVAPEAEVPVDPTGWAISQWLVPLFSELGFGALTPLGAAGLTADDGGKTFPISHRWNHLPVHLVAWHTGLDRRPTGAGTVPPQSLVQECLNRTETHLWGVVSNGRQLRLLRDSSALATASYVEFDLEAIFDGELFSEFVLLYRLLQVSRFAVAQGAAPSGCWLERWRGEAITSGTRALEQLRDGVRAAITTLGTGFLRHPDNAALRESVEVAALHAALLRLVYRLLFVFVAEDREALLDPSADDVARQRYAQYFSTARIRSHALRRRGTSHSDLYQGLRIVLDALGNERGRPELGLPGLGGIFDAIPADEPLRGLSLANEHLLEAVRHLARVRDAGSNRWRAVDYRHLDAEELGSIYESLLELIPRHSAVNREFELVEAAGNTRKTTGSYYTPSSLIDCLLDSALDPVIDDAVKRGEMKAAKAGHTDPAESVMIELLSLTVCDPACGSGHFLVAAARRIAKRVAAVREGNPEPTLAAVHHALHEVIARCVYGVDLNPMAVELAKVSLWLEALDPGTPLSFLDAHVKCGNSLLGATPALLRDGIPDKAFSPIEGDDRQAAKILMKRNAEERNEQFSLFETDSEVKVANSVFASGLRRITAAPAGTLAEVRRQAAHYRDLVASADYARARHVADAWCAAFVWPKVPDAPPAPTQEVFRALQDPADSAASAHTHHEIDRLARRHRFFHWHLEFPEVFSVSESGGIAAESGWDGGFSCVVGNPPWETLQLEDKQYFATCGRTDIAEAPNAAARTRMISKLDTEDPALADSYRDARRGSGAVTHFVRGGRFPLTATGKINTYSVFAETFRAVVGPDGAAGIITPTGLATDNTTAPFFIDILSAKRLLAFYDFENEAKIFPGVHNQFRFAVTALSGRSWTADEASLAFYTRYVEDVSDRRFRLTPEEILAINPNTGTMPMFRTRRDAEITLGIYRRHPVLIRDRSPVRNPWGLKFKQGLFNMASDSGLFRSADNLADARFDGWAHRRGTTTFLPLYEAKMLGHFDHRFGTYSEATQAQINKGTLPRPPAEQHDDPDMEPLVRYWVSEDDIPTGTRDKDGREVMEPGVRSRLAAKGWDRDWQLGWRDIARSSDMRTFVPAVLPTTAIGDKFLLAFPSDPADGPLLHAVWSSLVFDYVSRQKISGANIKSFIIKQLACPIPSTFADPTPWRPDRSLAEWVTPYVLELSYTSWRLQPYAREMKDGGTPFRWDLERRALLRADLDAAFLHVYGLTRPEAEHVIDSFFVVHKYEMRDHGEYRTRRLILTAYDRMATAITGGPAWTPLAETPAGSGPRHPIRRQPDTGRQPSAGPDTGGVGASPA